MQVNQKIQALLDRYRQIALLSQVDAVLGWDLNVNLPPKASQSRADQSALITKLIAQDWQESNLIKLIQDAAQDQSKLSLEEKAIVRNLSHSAHYYQSIPQEVIVEFSETTSKAFMAWQEAKTKDDFSLFQPHLARVVKLNQIIADHLGYKDNPYDALLDLYEPNLTAATCQSLFDELKTVLVPLLQKIQASSKYTTDLDFVGHGHHYSQDDQRQISLFVLRRMGYDLDAGRMDISSHPFTQTLAQDDVRITNRYNQTDFRESLMVAMHEGGHALYEQGIEPDYNLTPLDGGVSLGIHESQSRFWENQIGRSRQFIETLTPVLHAFYPESLVKIGSESLYRAFNQVKPSLIRTESDEVTYNLHILLRFEIENDLINDRLKVSDLPQVWNQKMQQYFGLTPLDNRKGVLQDVHWSYGNFGYFPTYTLGNLYAAQFTATLKKELDLELLLQQGNLGSILSWLRENIHQYGSLYWPSELIQKVTLQPLSAKYFTNYITAKYSDLY
jgi:carboxypeptidase Taq